MPVFDALAAELAETPSIWDGLKDMHKGKAWADNYFRHPLVRDSAPGSVLPLGLYVDGLQYQTRDSTVGWWCINLVTGRRHLLACLPKRESCRCGCGGHCSMHPNFVFLEWAFAGIARGAHPGV